MSRWPLLALMVSLAFLPSCQTHRTSKTDAPPPTTMTAPNYAYDKFGFQVDPASGRPLDSAYNRQLEKEIGR